VAEKQDPVVSYTIDGGRRDIWTCDAGDGDLDGGRSVGFRYVCLDMMILAIDAGTSV